MAAAAMSAAGGGGRCSGLMAATSASTAVGGSVQGCGYYYTIALHGSGEFMVVD